MSYSKEKRQNLWKREFNSFNIKVHLLHKRQQTCIYRDYGNNNANKDSKWR